MLLHARALINFFIRPSRFATDIRPTDFAPEWTPAPADAAKRAENAIDVLNKHLAHLTWERVEQGKQGWELGTIVVDLMQIAEEWCNHLALHHADLADQFRPSLLRAYQLVFGSLPTVPAARAEPDGQNA